MKKIDWRNLYNFNLKGSSNIFDIKVSKKDSC